MRKPLILIGLFFLLCLGASAYGILAYTPRLIQTRTAAILGNLGLKSDQLPQPEIYLNLVRYKNAKLDEQAFSTIKTLDIYFDPVSLLLFGKMNRAELSGITLTGKLSEDGHLSISGWNKLNFNLDPKAYKISSLDIKDAEIALLLPELGGLNAEFDVQILKKQNAFEFQGNISSKQKNISLTSRFTGHITPKGLWQADFELEQGKFDRPPIKATRISGALKLTGEPYSAPKFLGDLRAGGLSLYDIPWQDAAGGIEGTPSNIQISADMKSVGFDGVELSLNLIKEQGTPDQVNGTLHAETLAKILTYLQRQDLLPAKTVSFDSLAFGPASISFKNTDKPDDNKLIFDIQNNQEDIDIYGDILIDDNEAYNGRIHSAPLPLNTLNNNAFSDGTLTIDGTFQRKNKEKLIGTLTGQLEKATVRTGLFTVLPLSDTVEFIDLSKQNTPSAQNINCKISTPLPHKCTAQIEVTQGQLSIKDPIIEALGGRLTTDKKSENIWDLKAKNVNAKALIKALHIAGLSLTGNLQATLPVKKENNDYYIDNGLIKNESSGLIRLAATTNITELFDGQIAELQAIQSALSSFYYDQLEIGLNGPLHGPMDITIKLKGNNPKLYSTRQITINLKAKRNLSSLLKYLEK